jgi:membrane protein YdbS with pleckstrin-like domain
MNVARVIRLRDGERVLSVTRRYWPLLVPRLLTAAALVLTPFFLMLTLFSWGWPGYLAFAFIASVGALWGLRSLYAWYWDSFIVTDQRVIDVDQRGFFGREVAEAALDKIQDVSYRQRGPLQMMFGYGTVFLKTAGSGTTLELRDMVDPKGVHHMITVTVGEYAAALRGSGSGDRVAALLEAAAELSEPEARAFLAAIQRAAREEAAPSSATDDEAARRAGEADRRRAYEEWARGGDGA